MMTCMVPCRAPAVPFVTAGIRLDWRPPDRGDGYTKMSALRWCRCRHGGDSRSGARLFSL